MSILFVGLGNPGSAYEKTRHNMGFLVIDAILKEYGFPPYKKKWQALISEDTLSGYKVILAKPQTFMNNSGESVRDICTFHKIPMHHIFVIHDELDLPCGKIKVQKNAGAAGHNGIKSLHLHVGKDLWRIRVGIGHPGESQAVHNHVLSKFHESEKWTNEICSKIAKNIKLLCHEFQESHISQFINNITSK